MSIKTCAAPVASCLGLMVPESLKRFCLFPLAMLLASSAVSLAQSPSVMDDATVQKITIRGSAERIFEALTTPNQVVKWWGTEGRFQARHMESDLRVGGKWMIGVDARGAEVIAGGEYRIIERPRLLEFTWNRGGHEDPTETTVRFDLEERDGITTVRVTHSGLVTENLRRRNGGWPLILTLLQDYIERQSPSQQPPLMQRQKEIALALSACPSSVASKASVYVLEKSGYVKTRAGQNSFTAVVQHSLPTSQEPQCMDAEGARTFLPRMLKVAELRAEGKSPEDIKRFVADAFAKGVFPTPTRPGVIYMLSTENLVPDDKGVVGPFPPHVMFYGTHLTNADIGSEGQAGGGPAFVVNDGAPHALIIVPIGTHTGADHVPADRRPGSPQ